jgi:hypothetical protein
MTERDHSKNLGIDGRAVLNILNKQVWYGRLHSIDLGWRSVMDSCRYGNGLSGSTKYQQFG